MRSSVEELLGSKVGNSKTCEIVMHHELLDRCMTFWLSQGHSTLNAGVWRWCARRVVHKFVVLTEVELSLCTTNHEFQSSFWTTVHMYIDGLVA